MRKILLIVQKEFKQIFRNKMMRPILFLMPVVQLVVLSYSADFTVTNINIYIEDHDHTSMSHSLSQEIAESEYFNLIEVGNSYEEAYAMVEKNEVDVILTIPQDFSKNMHSGQAISLAVFADAINGTKAGISLNYLQNIIAKFSLEEMEQTGIDMNIPGIKTSKRDWYNPDLNYKFFMVPGILVLLVTIIALFLSGMNIVREKEIGTIEQLNVTPIRKYQFIIGKLLPFLILGMIEFTIGLVIALLWFKVPFEGNFLLIYGFTIVYLVLILGMGMFISTITNSQQQALFLAWFFMVIFILMSGLFTPIESMPVWAQNLTLFNPIRYYVDVIRLVMLKGSGISNILVHIFVITGSAILINLLAMISYRKTA